MALTKVGPAGIGSTPGTGYVIGDSFLHSTGLDSTNAKFTGIVTAQTFRVLGNFQVDGTTTTLDTEVTSVDKLEVAANNTTVGVAITQSGSGDILNLYDGSTEVFTVTDGGDLGVGAASPGGKLHLANTGGDCTAVLQSSASGQSIINFGDTADLDVGQILYNHSSNYMRFLVNTGEKLRITSAGSVGIGTDTPGSTKLKIESGSGTRAISLNAPTNGTYITFETAGTAYADIGAEKGVVGSGSADTPVINARGSRDLAFRTNSNERLRITSAGSVGIGTETPADKLSIYSAPNALIFGAKDTTRGNHIFQLLADDPAGNGELRLYRNSATGTHEKTVEIAASGNSYINSGSNFGINKTSPSAILHVAGTNYQTIRLENTDNGANGPYVELYNNSTSPADNDYLGIISFKNNNSASEEITYAQIRSQSVDVTDGTEDGILRFHTRGSGSILERLRITSGGNLGVGNDGSFPIYTGTNDRTLILGTGSEDSAIQIHSSGTGYGGVYFGDSTSGNARYNGYVEFKHGTNDDFLRFGTAATERLRISAGGSVMINTAAGLSDLQVCTPGSNNGTFRIGGSAASLGLVLDYDQNSNTLSRITANPTYTNSNSLFKICVDGDLNPDQLVLKGDGNVGINTSTFAANGTNFKVSDGTISRLALDKTGANARKFEIGNFGTGLNLYDVTEDAERLRITSGGLLGLGTNNPSLTGTTIGMHIAGGNAALKLQNTNNGDWAFIEYADESNTTRYVQGYRDSNGVYSIRPGTSLNATPGITLDSNGNVGIHETSPARQLSVYNDSNTGVEIKSGTTGQSSIFFTDTDDGNIGMIGYYHSDDSMFLRTNNDTRVTINSSGYVGINRTSPSDRLHVKGAILQQGYSDGAVVKSSVMVACFGAGTHNIFTCTATGIDNTAVATMEYVALYAYSGSNHYAGIKLASTRRSGNNTSWTNIANVAAAGSGNDTNIQPNLFFQNGVLMVTIPASTQVTATVRITVRSFSLTRNYSAG